MELNRRSFLEAGSSVLLGAAAAPRARLRPRVGIIGGGLSGVSCAWLLDGVADVVLFESRRSLGGHVQTIEVAASDRSVRVDVGAQFFSESAHPTYERLIEILGLSSQNIECEMSITLTETGRELPRFVSPSPKRAWAFFPPWNLPALLAFLPFALAARTFVYHGDWLVPLEDWLATLPVPVEQKEHLILPLLSAMIGCSLEEARGVSARNALYFVGTALPSNLLDPIRYDNSLLGLSAVVGALARRSRDLTAHLGSPVVAVRPLRDGGYRIENDRGISASVDVAIVTAPPYATAPLLSGIPALEEVSRILREFEYFSAEIAIHRDPVYMPQNHRYWSAYNPHVDGDFCEASIWYGALRPAPEGEAPLSLFKSWATARSTPPSEELFRRRFLHPRVEPGFIRAQRKLASGHQGGAGVWFAGSYMKEVDSQETALVSAMDVVRELAPGAPNLRRLQGRTPVFRAEGPLSRSYRLTGAGKMARSGPPGFTSSR
jgi:predicted NAD/FAD-binding protein